MTDVPLFHATLEGRPVAVGHAIEEELAALAAPVSPNAVRDVFELWSVVAIRDPAGRGVELHALAWRVQLGNTWITSALTRVDRTLNLVAGRSGHAYLLGRPDRRDLDPELREHLAYALRTWGYEDVR